MLITGELAHTMQPGHIEHSEGNVAWSVQSELRVILELSYSLTTPLLLVRMKRHEYSSYG